MRIGRHRSVRMEGADSVRSLNVGFADITAPVVHEISRVRVPIDHMGSGNVCSAEMMPPGPLMRRLVAVQVAPLLRGS